jgi:predicted HTH domain antitoxin
MPLVISDETLRDAKLTEREARIEIACRLFDAGRLSLPAAGRLAGLERNAMEHELRLRHIAVFRPTADDVRHDLAALEGLGG